MTVTSNLARKVLNTSEALDTTGVQDSIVSKQADKASLAMGAQNPVPLAHKHGFDGSCAPGGAAHFGSQQIGFSVGVFQWLPKSDGKGLKRSAVKIRVKGWVSDAERVYAKARELCQRLDAGESVDQKSITVS